MNVGKKIRVLVVDDSAFNRRTITRMLSSHPQIEVVDTAYDGQHAIKKVRALDPDVITLDLEMPRMDGFSFLRWLMQHHPKPVIVVSAHEGDRNVIRALEMGAFDFIPKPGGQISPKLVMIREELIAKVIAAYASKPQNLQRTVHVHPVVPKPSSIEPVWVPRKLAQITVIGASTGGPQAIRFLLSRCYLPWTAILIAQHMPPGFTRLFAERLAHVTHFRVKEAEHGETVHPGTVYIAPGGHHMEIFRHARQVRIEVYPRERRDRYAPSVDRLFMSAAAAFGPNVFGIILTGMGDDGLLGARAVKERGGTIVVESEGSATVFGMPKAVIERGYADAAVSLERIPDVWRQWLKRYGIPPQTLP